VSQHSTAFIRNVEEITVTFLALFVLEGSIGLLTVLFMIIDLLSKMSDDIFHAMDGLGIEEVKGIVGGWKVTVHAVGYDPLGVVDVG